MKKASKHSFMPPLSDKSNSEQIDKGKTVTVPAVKKTLAVRSITNEEYESLFDDVLKRMRDDYPSSQEEINEHLSQRSEKEYATLQPVPPGNQLNDIDAALESNERDGQPATGDLTLNSKSTPSTQRSSPTTPSNSHQPAWRAVSPVPQIKADNRLKKQKAKISSKDAKPSFSLGSDLVRNKKKDIRKPKGLQASSTTSKVEVTSKPAKRSSRAVKCKAVKSLSVRERQTDQSLPVWSLTQECTKGLWIQCGNVECCKWRYLDYTHDPAEFIDVKWKCSDNQDLRYAACSTQMQHWDEAADWTYSSYTEGSLVWAKIDGYPWWPGMVEIDPDLNAFVFCYDNRKYSPIEYHVTFFDSDKPTRSWLTPKEIKPFDNLRITEECNKKKGGNKRLAESIRQANEAIDLPLVQRLRTYGFTVRYTGKIVGHVSLNDSVVSTSQKLIRSFSQSPQSAKKGRGPHVTTERKSRSHRRDVNHVSTSKKKNIKQHRKRSSDNKENIPPKSGSKGDKSETQKRKRSKSSKDSKTSDLVNSSTPNEDEGPMPGKVSREVDIETNKPLAASEDVLINSVLEDMTDSQQLNMEQELDEIDKILSQSSQSLLRSQSLSPAPSCRRNTPVSPSSSLHRDSSFTRQDRDRSDGNISQRSVTREDNFAQPRLSQTKSRSVSPVPQKGVMKKGFKCPLINKDRLNSSVFTAEYSGKTHSTQNTAPNISQSSTDQSDTVSQVNQAPNIQMNLADNSLYTQELSGDNYKRSADNVSDTEDQQARNDKPADKRNKKLKLDSSVFTQELSGKKQKEPKTKTNQAETTSLGALNLNSSVFTQELSNKTSVHKGKTAKASGKGRRRQKPESADKGSADNDYGSYSEASASSSDADSSSDDEGNIMSAAAHNLSNFDFDQTLGTEAESSKLQQLSAGTDISSEMSLNEA